MRTGEGHYGLYEITAVNRFDDPVIAGMVVRTREIPRDVADTWPGIQARSAVETLAEFLPIAVLMFDVRGRIIFANDAACEMLASTPEALKRDGLHPVVAARDHHLIDDVLRVISATPGREQCLVRLAGAKAELVECRFSSEGFDEVTCVSLTMEDVTERHAAQQDLEQRASHDELTGLLNRAGLLALLETRLANQSATTVVFADLDGFKQVNDTWGHERGDQLLVAVADTLRSGLAAPAVAARLGGDEFVVVASDGPSVTRRIRELVAAVADREGLDMSCSVGSAVAKRGDAPADVVRRADEAMYASRARS